MSKTNQVESILQLENKVRMLEDKLEYLMKQRLKLKYGDMAK